MPDPLPFQFESYPETSDHRKASQPFSNMFNAYAKAMNKAYHRTGSFFQTPFGRTVVDSDSYLTRSVMYIHQNPQAHGIVLCTTTNLEGPKGFEDP